MLGLMQAHSLTVPWLLQHAARHHAGGEVISQTGLGVIHRSTWADTERRARRLVRVLQGLGIEAHDRVGTLAWNDHRHLETYYAASGMQAICHTINPRLSADDITYIINHAADSVLFADPGFAPLIGSIAANIAEHRPRGCHADRRGRHARARAAVRHAPAVLRRTAGGVGR